MSVIIPPWLEPREESHEWLDELSTVFQPEFAQGVSQRQSYGSCRLKIQRSHTVRGEDLAVLESALLSADGRFQTVYARGPHRANIGTIPTSELITNSTFSSGTTGFTSDSELTLSVVARVLRVRRVSTVGNASVFVSSISVGTTSEFRYVFRIFIKPFKGVTDVTVRFGTTAGGAEIESVNITSPGFYEMIPSVPGVSPMHISIRDNVVSKSVNDGFDIPFMSFSRCIYTSGAGQTGSEMTVGTSTSDGWLMPGDWVSTGQYQTRVAGCELKQVTQALTYDSKLYIKPAMFRSPADGAPVVCFQPFGKFLVSDLKIKNRLGVEADVSYTLEQVYD